MLNIDFKYLEFWTYYSSEGDIDKNLYREYCFGKIFDGEDYMQNHYTLYIYRNGYEYDRDNNCLITKKQLIEHIEEIKKVRYFEYDLVSIRRGYKLEFTIEDDLMWHKVILTWLRYSYEFPYNVALYEAFKVRKEKEFADLSLLNLFNLIGATMNCQKHGTDIHCIGRFYEFKKLTSYEEFKASVEKLIDNYPYNPINKILTIVEDNNLIYIQPELNYRINHTDYWKDSEQYKRRLKRYKHNLEILKTK